jgi:hypothetical protein
MKPETLKELEEVMRQIHHITLSNKDCCSVCDDVYTRARVINDKIFEEHKLITKQQQVFEAYQKTVNEIDDALEYPEDCVITEKLRDHLLSRIDNLTDKIKNIYEET